MKKLYMFVILFFIVAAIATLNAQNTVNDKNTPAHKNSKEIYNLGVNYANGTGVKKDMKTAHQLFLESANMGYARAQYNIGVIHLEGMSVKQDNSKAFKWFQMAANQNLPEGFYAMGMLYEEGKGTKKDIKKALGYYVRAADLGEKRALERIHEEPKLKKAEKFNRKGEEFYYNGDYSASINYYQKALAIHENILGKEHSHTAIDYNHVGKIYKSTGNYLKALEFLQKALTIQEKILGIEHIETADSYNNIGEVYSSMGVYAEALHRKTNHDYYNLQGKKAIKYYDKAIGYFFKALLIREKLLGREHQDTASSYNNMGTVYLSRGWGGDYSKALNYLKKALVIRKRILGTEHIDTATSYNNLGLYHQRLGEAAKSLRYYQKALAIEEKILGKEHPNLMRSYGGIANLYRSRGAEPNAFKYARKSFDAFLVNRDRDFTIFDDRQKKLYLKKNYTIIPLFLETAYNYMTNNSTQSKAVKEIIMDAWLNYKGSIFDSENTINMLYATTKDKKLKEKIEELFRLRRDLAKLYQTLPKSNDTWQNNIRQTKERISKLITSISPRIGRFKKQLGLKSITHKDIASHLKRNELYIDYAKIDRYYYIFSLDHQESISFVRIEPEESNQIDALVETYREDIATIIKLLTNHKLTDKKVKILTQISRNTLSKLYEMVIKIPLGDRLSNKTSLIISPDGALRLLAFETLYDKEKSKYFIQEKEIRYAPSGKELVRLYKYSKNKSTSKTTVIFANPDFDISLASLSNAETRLAIVKSLFNKTSSFAALPGTKDESSAIKAILKHTPIKEYEKDKATESALIKTQKPKILHIATHGFFINDNTIPNPMLKSGLVLAGANTSAKFGKGDGIVTALKLSGLDLEGTDLVVLSACQTGVVDINSTDTISGLSKAFIQAGAKDIVVSLWTVSDQATKDLMTFFYQAMQGNSSYAKALRSAKLKMIKDGRHPFYWGAFVVSGL